MLSLMSTLTCDRWFERIAQPHLAIDGAPDAERAGLRDGVNREPACFEHDQLCRPCCGIGAPGIECRGGSRAVGFAGYIYFLIGVMETIDVSIGAI